MHLILLPGLDGTGNLFTPLLGQLSARVTPVVARYPSDRFLGYAELAEQVAAALPAAPCWMVAESFSGPIALQVAARRPPTLLGVVLVGSFARSPWPSQLALGVHRSLLVAVPFAIRWLLLDRDAPIILRAQVQAAIETVPPAILAARLRALLRVDVRWALRELAVPLFDLRAEHDRLVPRRASLGACARCLSLPGPHLLLQRHPRACAALLEGLLATR